MKFSGSEKSGVPMLHFIANSAKPDADTMNLSPDDLRKTDKSYLRLRGYGLAFALYHFAMGEGEYLDSETFTWFPEDRLPCGHVARGYWSPGRRKVRFCWYYSDYRNSNCGARVAMSVPLKT